MFLTSNNGGCIISPDNGSKVGLKAQKLLAQGVLDVTYDTPSFCFVFLLLFLLQFQFRNLDFLSGLYGACTIQGFNVAFHAGT